MSTSAASSASAPDVKAASLSVEEALTKPVEDMAINGRQADTNTPGTSVASGSQNGTAPTTTTTTSSTEEDATSSSWPDDDDGGGGEKGVGSATASVKELRADLERAKGERDSFEAQYKGLLAKLTQMRSTLGNRLRQDAVGYCCCCFLA